MSLETTPNWPVMSIEDANKMLTSPGAMFELEDRVIDGVSLKTYKNAPPNLRVVFENTKIFGDREFLIYKDERITFTAHARAVAHFAKALVEEFGIQKGDRIAIIMRNYPQWSVAFWAGLSIGAIVTPLNSWWTGDELHYGLKDSSIILAIFDGQIYDRLKDYFAQLPDLQQCILARGSRPEGADSLYLMDEMIGSANSWGALPQVDLPEVALSPEDNATIMYTSGTTGRPKGALASHRAIISNFFNSISCQARAFLRRGETPPQPDPNIPPRVILLSIPFFHVTGAFAILVPSIAFGQRIVTVYKWDPDEALEIIEREKITTFGGVPAIAWQVLEHPRRSEYDLSSIEAVAYGGAPSAPELVATIKRHFTNAIASNGWGMTETCATSTQNLAEDYENRPQSAGAAPPAMELKVVGPDGKTLPYGEMGELWVKGPNNCKAYWNKPEASEKTYIDGWVVTGDLARMDEEGFIFIMDRAKDMLIRGGENIYSIEVENALYDHPAIMDAAIVGIPHKILGEEVGAVVQLAPGMKISTEELQAHVGKYLAAFKVPVEIIFQTDPLPRNANGKILKTQLRERFTPRT